MCHRHVVDQSGTGPGTPGPWCEKVFLQASVLTVHLHDPQSVQKHVDVVVPVALPKLAAALVRTDTPGTHYNGGACSSVILPW